MANFGLLYRSKYLKEKRSGIESSGVFAGGNSSDFGFFSGLTFSHESGAEKLVALLLFQRRLA
jgi:hypothetical protein